MPYELPLFPLQVVLFPGAPLPLHVFEPRYRQLLADCLEGDHQFGLTSALRPAPGSIGCVALIRLTHPLPDGRSNIVVTGGSRFAVASLLELDRPYPVAVVEDFDDDPGSAPSPETLSRLYALASRYREALALLSDAGGDEPGWAEQPVPFSFQVAALLDAPLEAKERLLRLRSTAGRTELLLDLLPDLLQTATQRASVHVRARSNGAGGDHYDLLAEA